MSAIAGIDQALWDIKGKHHDAPVYDLLGGPAREKIRVYQGVGGETPAAVAEDARAKVEAGLTAVKTGVPGPVNRVESPAGVESVREYVGAIREEVGAEVDVAVDFHGRVAKQMAKKLAAALDEFDLMFLEEPVLSEQNEALPEIAARTSAPIATGERMYSRYDFKDVLETVDVIQPDLSHAGGITEVHKLASMADAYDTALAPHCPLGPIAFASCLQVDANAPNALVQEQSLGLVDAGDNERLDYLADSGVFGYGDGFVPLPDGPGLGIEIDEETVERRAGPHGWHNPVWRHEDGSVAEW